MESEINDRKMCAVIQSRILLPNRFVASYTPLAMANRNDSSELVMRCLSLKSLAAIKFYDDGHLLISLALTLSVGSDMSIALHVATQARRPLVFTAAGLRSTK